MVVFTTSENEHRWVSAGLPCAVPSRVLMMTDDYQLHGKDARLLREMAEAVGARKELEAADAHIWQ